jgi:hypothetical protein
LSTKSEAPERSILASDFAARSDAGGESIERQPTFEVHVFKHFEFVQPFPKAPKLISPKLEAGITTVQ